MKKKIWKKLSVNIDIPSGIEVKYDCFELEIKKGDRILKKIFKFPNVSIKVENQKIEIFTKKLTKRQKKTIHTYRAHIKNMFLGVEKDFEYRLKVVYAKFPITIEVKENEIIVKNFLGRKVPIIEKITKGVKVKMEGKSEIIVNGSDIEKCGNMTTKIEQMTRINHFDRRVIQDGIWITKKPHKTYGEEE